VREIPLDQHKTHAHPTVEIEAPFNEGYECPRDSCFRQEQKIILLKKQRRKTSYIKDKS
jgi:hypothetical protein